MKAFYYYYQNINFDKSKERVFLFFLMLRNGIRRCLRNDGSKRIRMIKLKKPKNKKNNQSKAENTEGLNRNYHLLLTKFQKYVGRGNP